MTVAVIGNWRYNIPIIYSTYNCTLDFTQGRRERGAGERQSTTISLNKNSFFHVKSENIKIFTCEQHNRI